MACAVRDFAGTAPNSLKNHLNREELARVTITSLGAGGGLFGLLQAIVLGAGVIFPAPTDAALAAAVLTVILEVIRRLRHGAHQEPFPVPGPHPRRRKRCQ